MKKTITAKYFLSFNDFHMTYSRSCISMHSDKEAASDR